MSPLSEALAVSVSVSLPVAVSLYVCTRRLMCPLQARPIVIVVAFVALSCKYLDTHPGPNCLAKRIVPLIFDFFLLCDRNDNWRFGWPRDEAIKTESSNYGHSE